MEGQVHDLGQGRVGKAWAWRTEGELRALAAFYEELAAQDLPWDSPRILAVHRDGDRVVSIERRLHGTALSTASGSGQVGLEQARACVQQVVADLDATRAGPATRALAVLDQGAGLRRAGRTWGRDLAALVAERVHRFAPALRAALPDLDAVAAQVVAALEHLEAGPERIVHGDLCPENILVDEHGRVSAVLDWGFFTTAGDGAFDAATAAGFFDMYGPRAREHEEAMLEAFAARGWDRELMALYRAAYGLAGANAYSDEGDDGHFAWCVAALDRPQVRRALQRRA
ncbi:phosphotransferase [Nocardiopsis sp. HNM0947]|uniref:Phosphotransferase n=2 Tax=Nocardiopsis coralli TaxID=2772213 RepID=A0ABR9P6V7_9ACTN|nr:phosphotransferase [Nocardiopsis coralli]